MSEMAPPTQQTIKTKGTFDGKRANRNQPYNRPGGRKKWVSEHKVFDGSIGEGQGFAFKRKEKVKHEYNKLLRKERRKNTEVKTQYTEQYPEHLRHLYEAEAEKLRNEVKTNRINRTKARMAGGGGPVEEEAAPMAVNEAPTDLATAIDPAEDISSDKTDSAPQPTPAVAASKNDSLPMSNRSKKKMLRKTSYQKTKEEFESVKEKQKNKKEEFLKNKEQKEEAIMKYKQKKMETFQMLSKKTKKGQPNLNLQMEYLLQKIQGTGPGK
ncbi:thyroid transcription factor 1-associated protein 26 homolog isoform X2 [Oncorhynchus clarkii lewisi]|uniref:thyroid transcription factor 1-associated protein 26 homolog isoform X2 n=1 Tax=Oncorhynchus clarkii lewisi TaxID=490388 RepID=UPI0039B87FC8